MTKRGMLIVLSGPSGVGKGTVRKAILIKIIMIFSIRFQ